MRILISAVDELTRQALAGKSHVSGQQKKKIASSMQATIDNVDVPRTNRPNPPASFLRRNPVARAKGRHQLLVSQDSSLLARVRIVRLYLYCEAKHLSARERG